MNAARQPADMILYTYYLSSCTWRVRIALSWKRLPVEQRPVDLAVSEQHSAAFAAVNPQQQVPALLDGDLTVCQSLAILEYLEEAYPQRPLLPAEPARRALVRQICQLIVSGIQPLQHRRLLDRLEELGGADERRRWAHDAIAAGLAALEPLLARSAGTCCVGDAVTLADCCLVPQVYNARHRFGVCVERFPTVSRVAAALAARTEFASTHPQRQRDCPEHLRAGEDADPAPCDGADRGEAAPAVAPQ